MIIFLYGPDDYRREAKKREIVAEFQKKRSDLGIGRFDLVSEDGFKSLQEFLMSQSLFQPKKMAILDNGFELEAKVLKKILLEVLENKNITVLMSEKDKPVKALDFLLKEPVVNQKFENLEGKEWENFILKEAKRVEVKITAGALRFLAGVYQNNSWGLVTEFQKVKYLGNPAAFRQDLRQASSGSHVEIDVRDLEDLGVEQVPNFFSLILGFKNRNLSDRLWALEKIFSMNEPAAKIFNILAYQLPDKLQDMARYDLMVKSGKLEYEEALLNLVIE